MARDTVMRPMPSSSLVPCSKRSLEILLPSISASRDQFVDGRRHTMVRRTGPKSIPINAIVSFAQGWIFERVSVSGSEGLLTDAGVGEDRIAERLAQR